MPEKTIYFGTFVQSVSLESLEICPTSAIGVDEAGKIAFVERQAEDPTLIKSKWTADGWGDAKFVEIKGQGFFFPGFIGAFVSLVFKSHTTIG